MDTSNSATPATDAHAEPWPPWAARLVRLPQFPLYAAIVLAVAALAEVTVRLQMGQSSLTRVRAGAPGSSAVTLGGQRLSVQFIVVVCLVALGTTLPLGFSPALRRVGAAVITGAVVVSLTPLHLLTAAGVVAQLAVAFHLGNSGSRILAPSLGVPLLVLTLLHPPDSPGEGGVAILLAGLVPLLAVAGMNLKARRDLSANSALADQLAGRQKMWTAQEERARIARELHDVVAHHISLIAVQAETARLTTPGLTQNGAAQLRRIGDTARSALTEMRRLLGVLREDTGQPRPGRSARSAEPAPREPQPGLRQFARLLDQARESTGTAARLILRGSPVPLDPGVELAAYRIVQEALTNARRHAAGAAVDVELVFTRRALRLRIRDNGPGPSALFTPGLGLLGIHERTLAVGGCVVIGSGPGGGFQIEATLPTKEAG